MEQKNKFRLDKVTVLEDYNNIKKGTEFDFSNIKDYIAIIGLSGSGKSSFLDSIYNSFSPWYETFFHEPQYKGLMNNQIYSIEIHCKEVSNSTVVTSEQLTQIFFSNEDCLPSKVIYNYSGEIKQYFAEQTGIPMGKVPSYFLDSSSWNLVINLMCVLNPSYMEDILPNSCNCLQIADFFVSDIQEQAEKYKHFKDCVRYCDFIINCGEKIDGIERDFCSNVVEFYARIRFDKDASEFFNKAPVDLVSISEGQKKIMLLKFIFELMDDDRALILLDEPDSNLDVRFRQELFELIRNAKGQVVLTTHDPIMTKKMQSHICIIDEGVPFEETDTDIIKYLSSDEISMQEEILTLKNDYFVIVEGKDDVNYINTAIKKLGYGKRFRNVSIIPQFSANNVQAFVNNYLNRESMKNKQKFLFLFDFDDGGVKGYELIVKLVNYIKDYPEIKELEILEGSEGWKTVEYSGKRDKLETFRQLYKNIDTVDYIIDYNKIDALYYNNYDNSKKYSPELSFCVESFFSQDTNDFVIQKVIDSKKDFSMESFKKSKYIDSNEKDFFNFGELYRIGKMLNKVKADIIKNYIENHFEDICIVEDFEGFRPLLDAILEKLGL